MFKSLLFLLLSILFTPCAFANEGMMLPGAYFSYHDRWQNETPIEISFVAFISTSSDSVSIDITPPSGISNFKGDLHWTGNLAKDQKKIIPLSFDIDNPGVYEFTAVCKVYNIQNWHLKQIFPTHDTLIFYNRDNVYRAFESRQRMADAIKRLAEYEKTEKERVKRVKVQYVPVIIQYDLNEIWYGNYTMMRDTAYLNMYNNRSTSKPIFTICSNNLLFSPPHTDSLEAFIVDDFSRSDHNLTNAERDALVSITKRQLGELYQFDQKIIHATDSETQRTLLAERHDMLIRQKAGRIEAAHWRAKPGNR